MQVRDLLSGVSTNVAGRFLAVDEQHMRFGNIPIQVFGTYIGTVTFTGAGLDDMEASGVYTGPTAKTYRVRIDGTGDADTFEYSTDGGTTWSETDIEITGEAQAIGSEGVSITFGAVTGHTLSEYWDIVCAITFTGTVHLEGAVATEQEVREGTARWATIESFTASKCDMVEAAYPFIRGRTASMTKGAVFLKAYV